MGTAVSTVALAALAAGTSDLATCRATGRRLSESGTRDEILVGGGKDQGGRGAAVCSRAPNASVGTGRLASWLATLRATPFLCPLEHLAAGWSELRSLQERPHEESAPCPHCKDGCSGGRSLLDTVIRTFAPGATIGCWLSYDSRLAVSPSTSNSLISNEPAPDRLGDRMRPVK